MKRSSALRRSRILRAVMGLLLVGPAAHAAAPKPAPVSGRAVGFAVSARLSDVTAAPSLADERLPAEWIRENDRLPRSKGPFHPGRSDDPAIQRTLAAAPTAMPGPAATFPGISADDASTVANRVAPPDTVGDVGPNHYVQAVNLALRVFDKSGNPLTDLVSLGSFFEPLGSNCNGSFGDPIVLYDPLADRWLVSQFGLPNNFQPPFHQCIGISQTGDPTGAFYLYDFHMPDKVNDYPHFGVWPDGYYMSDNQFAIGGAAYAGAGFTAFDRAKMLVGDPTATYVYFDYFPIDPTAGGMLPTDLDGLTPPPPGTPNFFMEFRADEFGDPFDALRIYEFHADFETPGSSTLTVRADLPVAPFDARVPAARTVVEEPPPAVPSDYLDAIADRMMHRIAYRTLSGGVESFVCNWTVNVSGLDGSTSAAYQAGVRFEELRRDSVTGAFSIQNQVTYAPGSGDGANGRNVWMGSAAQDHQGNVVLGFSASSTSVFPSIVWAGRLAGDPANTLAQGEATVIAGANSQRSTGNRWGDYSALTVDPSDDCTFFYTQEVSGSSVLSFHWVTQVASVAYPSCTPAPRGTVSGIVTACGGGPLAGAVVSDGLGHVRTTDDAGAYSMELPPGAYTLTIAKANYTSGGGPVTITNGGTATLDACLTGLPAIAAAGATLSAESCIPANGVPDPGETVTVSLCLRNAGAGDTTDLVATLAATGGVVRPPAPVDFGVVPAGGAAVCRDVVFAVDPSLACGGTLTATFALQDGATSYDPAVVDFPTGLPVVVFTEGFDGVTPPALPAGWTASNAAGGSPLWTTTTSAPDSLPNDAFIVDPPIVSDKRLDSSAIPIATSSAMLTFRSSYAFETNFDGGVLEISIGGAPFDDVLAAGGSFVAGGYTATLSPSANPLAGRSAWTGTSAGYVTTVVSLPASAAGSSVVFRWRLGSDSGIGGAGWRIDNVSLSDGYACCGGIEPAALAADARAVAPPSNVDGVWEPGETVEIAPTWANNGTSSASPTGTAANLTGPAGAAYQIVDAQASYPTLGAAATGSCADAGDCYAMSVSAPTPRPAAHWDATFDEQLSTGDGKTWTLHIGGSFADVARTDLFYAWIEDIFHHGISGGCGAGAYCPTNPVTRAQMAVFILKAEHGSAYAPPPCAGVFADVACPGGFAVDWIERLHAEGITGGCGGGNYCPTNPVTRAQMAVFLLKGQHGSDYVPPSCAGVFPDVPCPAGFAADWIERLYAEGITGGCGGGNYCPDASVMRGQMAAFLAKTFGLVLYGP